MNFNAEQFTATQQANLNAAAGLSQSAFAGFERLVELNMAAGKAAVGESFANMQALMAAKAGAAFVSPFIGRLDDHGADGMELIHDIRTIYDNYDFSTAILAASVRNAAHVRAAALAGADCATIPPSVFLELYKHPLTDRGLEQFNADWAKTGQSIL